MGAKWSKRRVVVDERYARPQGLYPVHDIDLRKLRKLILDGKLAPCYPGQEDVTSDLEDCPICFLHYPSLNRSRCCGKSICTECFLQLKSPQGIRPAQCPFCKLSGYAVEFRGAKSLEEKGQEQAEEQKVIEANIRMRREEALHELERARKREEDLLLGRPPQPPTQQDHPRATPPAQPSQAPPPLPPTAVAAASLTTPHRTLQRTASRQGTPVPAGSLTTMPASPPPPPPRGHILTAEMLLERVREQREALSLLPHPPVGVLRPEGPRGEEMGWAREGSSHGSDQDPDLEDLLLAEAIWQSLHDQGAQLHDGEGGGRVGHWVRARGGQRVTAGGSNAFVNAARPAELGPSSSAPMPLRPPPVPRQDWPSHPEGSSLEGAQPVHSVTAGDGASQGSAPGGRRISDLWAEGVTEVLEETPRPEWAAAGVLGGRVPQTYDEQIALALALSLADAQGQGGVSIGTPGDAAAMVGGSRVQGAVSAGGAEDRQS